MIPHDHATPCAATDCILRPCLCNLRAPLGMTLNDQKMHHWISICADRIQQSRHAARKALQSHLLAEALMVLMPSGKRSQVIPEAFPGLPQASSPQGASAAL